MAITPSAGGRPLDILKRALQKFGVADAHAGGVRPGLPHAAGREIDSHDPAHARSQQQFGVADAAAQAQDYRFAVHAQQSGDARHHVPAQRPHRRAREVRLRKARVQPFVVIQLSPQRAVRLLRHLQAYPSTWEEVSKAPKRAAMMVNEDEMGRIAALLPECCWLPPRNWPWAAPCI